ncbi:uncharacterized protein KY384_005951 [Bacidia gigantensis]|uniref:uncharacterized protein n=1 Tax=Bacidia gigantensis TaxID=2732470 RepID=UPI001D03A443|nr:uncharacterized protein KY384_005951 [Bacidia gigantensis]KAG8529315.1 hypothetical protein KY384_005951 [Bacidia gigantensis]
MDGSQAGSAASANSSSDFVRKLYKMLEDPSYSQVVRWGDDGGSFVVLENEKFTKSILPKHFKHSNFASFVRQLNKYDFHKVRHNNEEGGTSPYGAGAWEFKHPEFKANSKDSLDNIRRKAPAPRKAPQVADETGPTQQMDLVNTQLVATQQQLEQLQQRHQDLAVHHSMLVQELIGVQKTVVNHEHVMQNVMSYLHSVDARQRRDSRVGGPFAAQMETKGPSSNVETQHQMSPLEDEPASPLQKASNLLNDLSADEQLNYKTLENMNHDLAHQGNGFVSTPPPDGNRGHQKAATSAASSTSIPYAKLHHPYDGDNVVYPAGQPNGIDPAYSEHLPNIPYPLPSKDSEAPDTRSIANRKKSTQVDPGWSRAPQILLVEDDPTCRRIGSKFLYSFHCAIDSAFDGLEAVNKMNAGSKYDLVLMDIIMPNLDGVSACHLIRQFDHTPIVAMTSNIRSDDISMYFQHGMNDVLPKPFTKEGLLSMLDKHLGHLKRMPDGMEPMPNPPPIPQSSVGTSLKEENSPADSPSTMSNWQSPGPYSGISPIQGASSQSFMQPLHSASAYSSDQSPMSYQPPHTPIGGQPQMPHRRQISELGPDEISSDQKRQRVYDQSLPMGQMQPGRAR